MNWKWIENELIHYQMNGELNWFTFFQNEWWIELIHCFLEMNGELNDSPKIGEWTHVCQRTKLKSADFLAKEPS